MKNGRSIVSVESWFAAAPPKRPYQWRDGRSAKELARAFCQPAGVCVAAEVQSLLDSSPLLGHVEVVELWPEHKIPLDSFAGETRNADLAGTGLSTLGPTAITVEAKADEPFGDTVATALARSPERSKRPARIEALSAALFSRRAENISNLRYQLLHASVASLILARQQRASAAIFVVYEFRGPATTARRDQNADDLRMFVGALASSAEQFETGRLFGPVRVPGNQSIPSDVPLFIGKAVRHPAPVRLLHSGVDHTLAMWLSEKGSGGWRSLSTGVNAPDSY